MLRSGITPGAAYIIFIGSIDTKSAEELIEVLSRNIPEKTRTLYFLFSTKGGSVSAGFSMYNILKALPYDIIMHNIGSVDSIGSVVFLAGKERYSTPNGTFLINKISTKRAQKGMLNYIKVEQEKISNVITSSTKITRAELSRLFKAGELKKADYALKKGIISEIRELALPSLDKLIVIRTI